MLRPLKSPLVVFATAYAAVLGNHLICASSAHGQVSGDPLVAIGVLPDAGMVTIQAASNQSPSILIPVPIDPALISKLANSDGTSAPIDLGVVTSIFQALYAQAQAGNWNWLLGLLLMVIVYVSMRFLKPKFPALSTPLGGLSFSAGISIVGALGTTFLAAGPGAIHLATAVLGLKIGLGTSASFALGKKILEKHSPPWVHSLLFPPAPTALTVDHAASSETLGA